MACPGHSIHPPLSSYPAYFTDHAPGVHVPSPRHRDRRRCHPRRRHECGGRARLGRGRRPVDPEVFKAGDAGVSLPRVLTNVRLDTEAMDAKTQGTLLIGRRQDDSENRLRPVLVRKGNRP